MSDYAAATIAWGSETLTLLELLKKQLDILKKKPKDEATDEAIEHINAERTGLMRLRQNINNKQALNFFTDGGLLPNYAFPEEGVKHQQQA